jgi:hypothetical protein
MKSKKGKKHVKIISFDHVDIPMGDKTIIDKFVSWRRNSESHIDILVKYKVCG